MTLLTKENFIIDNEISIGETLWAEILKAHTLDEIADYMHKIIVEEDIPFPYQKISHYTLKDSFSKIKNADPFKLLRFEEWKNFRVEINYPFTYKGQYIYIAISSLGRHCSNYFFQEIRMKVDVYGLPSPFDRWKIHKYRNMFKFLEHTPKVGQSGLLTCLTLKNLASQFSTSSAKVIYEITQARNILDFCGGWGDRLIGALSSQNVISYTGIDPNAALHPKYEEVAKYYKHNKKTKFICAPAEDAQLDPNQFDVIFTSPPYFDLEIYSYDENQSSSRYKNLEAWLNNFLFKVIEKCFYWLQEDGRMLLNISDYRGKIFCQRMIDYAISLGFKFEGIIGLEITQRPGSNKIPLDTISGEPIFVFAKGNPPDLLLDNPNTLF